MEVNNMQENVNLENTTNVTAPVENAEVQKVVAPQKKYIFRKLKATDIGLMTSVIKKIGVNKISTVFKNEEIRQALNNNNKNENLMMTVGIVAVTELVQLIVEAYDQCEMDLHKLLSNTSNLSEEEVKELEFNEFFNMLFNFFNKY